MFAKATFTTHTWLMVQTHTAPVRPEVLRYLALGVNLDLGGQTLEQLAAERGLDNIWKMSWV